MGKTPAKKPPRKRSPRAAGTVPFASDPSPAGRPAPAPASAPAAEVEVSGPRAFPIVGVGASAGGLEAMTDLLRSLPADTGMAFVLVTHLDPNHPSFVTEILQRSTSMPITEVSDEPRVEPDHVYMIPPGKNMTIEQGVLKLLPRVARGIQRPVDIFLRSLAEDRRHLAIGVVLSGTANDGTAGLEAIKAEGGISFAQDKSALYDGMPHSAIAAGCVDFVLPPGGISREIARIGRHPYVAPIPMVVDPVVETDMERVLAALRNITGVDFSEYKGRTLSRRIARRMVLHKIDAMKDYADLVHTDAREVDALFQDILISVTSFFRNPEAFEALRTRVFPELAKGRSRFQPVRIWVVGCSTGEEAYSLAMEWKDFADHAGISLPVQIFATDLNQVLVERARAGFYRSNIVQDVSPDRIRRYFTETEGGYQVARTIRDMCVFAKHNVLGDPPFSNIDMASCRNLLIYLEADLQKRVVPLLHYALKPNGYLFLGGSETVGMFRDQFEPFDPKYKIYLRKPGLMRADLAFPKPPRVPLPPVFLGRQPEREIREGTLEPHREADRMLLTRYAPASVLVNDEFDILQFRGETGTFLSPSPGRASLNVIRMAREGLLLPLRAALQAARQGDSPVREENVYVKTGTGIRAIHLDVIPIHGASARERSFLVVFEDPGPAAPRTEGDGRGAPPPAVDQDEKDRQIAHLTQELSATRDYLQSVIEQQEAANEELQSANEEVQSINEELQSINEELETSKEEIQSSNEELSTLNDELQERNLELARSNDDFNNLLASVQTAIVFVGRDLRIRKFTPAAEKLLNLIGTDMGRPITDIKLGISADDLEPILIEVIDTVGPRELEVQDRRGRWNLLRLRPYKTLDSKIDGAVLMLVDIDDIKRDQEKLRRQAELLDQTYEPILVWRLDGTIVYWNRGAETVYGFTREEATGRNRIELMSPTHQGARFMEDLRREGRWTGELNYTGRDGKEVVLESRMYVLQSEGSDSLVLETDHPITERKRLENELRRRAHELIDADRRKNEYLALLAHELRNPLASLSNSIQIMRAPEVDANIGAQALAVMDRQLRSLARMIDDLIDVAAVTQGKIQLKREVLDFRAIASRAATQCESLFAERSQHLSVEIPSEPLPVSGDPVRLEQVLANLLHNASKFSPRGSTTRLSVSQEKAAVAGRDGDMAVARVEDDGNGIPAGMLPRIFELFVQGDNSLARTSGGLGIGLTLVRQLVEMHGGSVEARSPGPGAGSTFIVRLPLAPPGAGVSVAEPAEATSLEVPSRRVLVVDDIADSADTLATRLRLSGHEVRVAYHGEEALKVVAEFAPEIVLLDIGLPGMDGYSVARKIRRLPGSQGIVLVALTGYGQSEDRRLSAETGFHHHLTKPVDSTALRAILAGFE